MSAIESRSIREITARYFSAICIDTGIPLDYYGN